MKAKIIALIFVGLIAGTLGTIKSRKIINKAQTDRQEFSTGSLLWYVQQAKNKGEKQITIPASTVDYAGSSNSTTLEKALSVYDCVIATVIDKQTIPRKDEIVTWYNFKIAETVSKSSKAVASNDESGLPEQLRQADDDEFIIAQNGGTILMNDVKLIKVPEYPPFQIGKRYLLFVRRQPSGKGEIVGGPVGAFAITEDNNLSPIAKIQHPLITGIKNTFNNSLSNFREGVALHQKSS
jgi:hypothetical protein